MEELRSDLRRRLDEEFEVDIESIHHKLVDEFGDDVYLVGGAVRDKVLGEITGKPVDSKDMDYLITGVPLDELERRLDLVFSGSGAKIVRNKKPAENDGDEEKDFGVFIVTIPSSNGGPGDQFEFAIPRRDVDRHTVVPDHTLSVEDDLMRRDLTFNAIAERLSDGTRVSAPGEDPIEDLKNKRIKSVGSAENRFAEDPLRILRAIQFAARFGFKIDPETMAGIRTEKDLMISGPNTVDIDRYREEFNKAWTKGNKDTEYFFELLDSTGVGQMLYGTDFDPIPVRMTTRVGEPFLTQLVAMFLNGGDYKKTFPHTDYHKIIELARVFKDIIENGYSSAKHYDYLSNKMELFPLIEEVFKRISKDLYSGFVDLMKKPVTRRAGQWQRWMLPLHGGHLKQISGEEGYTITGAAFTEISKALVDAYQQGKIPTSSSENKSIALAGEYLVNELLPKDRQLNDSIKIGIIHERIKNILDNA